MPHESYGDNQLIPFDQLIASQLEATRRREEELAAQMAAEQRARQVPSPNQNDQQRRIIAGQLEREFGITCSEILSSGLPKDTVADEKLRSSSGGLSGQGTRVIRDIGAGCYRKLIFHRQIALNRTPIPLGLATPVAR